LFVRPRDLRRQIDLLRGWGYTLTTFGDLADRAATDEADGFAALTFDDGFEDNLTTVLPLLTEYGAAATVFVVSGWLGQPHLYAPQARILREDELRSLREGGVEIGAHSVTHPDLTTLAYDAALSELTESKSALEEVLQAPVEVAAYPFGRATDETIRACREAGFRAACRISGEGSWDDPYNLPRQDMDNRCSVVGLRLKRADRYEPLMRHAPFRIARGVRRRLLSLR
jgi:peptidoglycan/xylan/chitin deacetylase (PgdA/CDA1 family)